MERGKNIVVFGCDNTGKTTLSEFLVEKIKSEKPELKPIYKKIFSWTRHLVRTK